MAANNNINNSFASAPRLDAVNQKNASHSHASDDSINPEHLNQSVIENKTDIFGTRYLNDPNRVYEHNAWDNVEWNAEQIAAAEEKISENSSVRMSEEEVTKAHLKQHKAWDEFYLQHQDNFFKDRNWLFTAFPELYGSDKDMVTKDITSHDDILPHTMTVIAGSQTSINTPETVSANINSVHKFNVLTDTNVKHNTDNLHYGAVFSINHINSLAQKATIRILDAGCGVGNSTFPILESNSSPNLFVYCCDFANSAIKLIQNNPSFSSDRVYPFICDLTAPTISLPFPPNSIDYILLLFVLSAIPPGEQMQLAVSRLSACLKPGGMLLFRDYGRYDMAQLRFKGGSCMENDCYMRGDGTQAFFFTEEKVRQLFVGEGQLEEIQLESDRRLQVNRGKKIKMYRVWIQAKFGKPLCRFSNKLSANDSN